ncbi:MAG: T6SS immunity protein Tli4 family protein, partial [Acidihalobacter sp.]
LFVAETSPADPSLATPKLHFELLAGRADGGSADHSSSLTDNEAVALWDAVLKTLRPRIDAVAANSNH